MTIPIPLVVTWILVREVGRSLATPFHLLVFLLQRKRWVARAQEALSEPAPTTEGAWLLRASVQKPEAPHLFVSAGEASGEMHAANLVRTLRAAACELRISGFGGQRLEASGATLLWPLADRAVMGITAVVASLPFFVRAVARFARLLRDDRPDLVVLVDYPGLHLVFAELCKQHGVPVVHYVAPQYWAWGPWRMRRYAKAFSWTLTILPFEPAWFTKFGVASRYIGHPLLDQIATTPPDQRVVARLQQAPLVVLLPGSRAKEIRSHLPGLLQVAQELRARAPELQVVVVQHEPSKAALVRALVARLPLPERAAITVHEGDMAAHLAAARLVIAKSGTGSLEAVLRGAVTIVVYLVASRLAKVLYERLVMVPFFASANLIAGEALIPEFGFAGAEGNRAVARKAAELLPDGPDRTAVLAGTARVRARLRTGGATARAAACILASLRLTSAS